VVGSFEQFAVNNNKGKTGNKGEAAKSQDFLTLSNISFFVHLMLLTIYCKLLKLFEER